MNPLFARLSIAVAVSSIFAGSVHALPGTVRTDHPRLFAYTDDLRRLIKEVPLLNPVLPGDPVSAPAVTFPGKRGKLRFQFQPSMLTRFDGANAVVFGNSGDAAQGFYLQYVSSDDRNAILTLGAKVTGQKDITTTVTLPIGMASDIEIEWDVAARKLYYRVGTATVLDAALPTTFDASTQPFLFGGRRGDQMPEFRLFDGAGTLVRSFVRDPYNPAENNGVNLELGGAWHGMLIAATNHANEFAKCLTANTDCGHATKGRSEITELAKTQVLAYRLTKDPLFLKGARDQLELIYRVNAGTLKVGTVATNPGTGGEWSMAARVGAMGVYYDWLFDTLGADEKVKLRDAIKTTVQFNNAGVDDLRYSICGLDELAADSFACAKGWDDARGPSSIARNYITGHTQAAQFGTLLGLLAIRHELTDVDPMIDTIYRHFKDGYNPARAAVSYAPVTDAALQTQPWLKNSRWGGHQTMFSYNSSSAGELPERMLVWQRAISLNSGETGLPAPWLPYLISPYIYGLRGDGKFPASGDNFAYNLGESDIAFMPLIAAQRGDATAYGFYREQILAQRRLKHDRSLWERLTFPVSAGLAAQSPANLPLSAHYTVGGNVLMRDTWDYANAALLDFKSASFISENHHHLDQNSFSLFYKAPLLVDSGQYDSYESVHWKNYYTRTIAHNSVVLYEPGEKFQYSSTDLRSEDGGQWYDGRNPYPTIAEITSTHKLDGVTAYEEGGWFAYTQGDATKAYRRSKGTDPGKLNPEAGFVRSIVYVRPEGRPNDTGAKATVVVFDKVRTPATVSLAATSLLHTVAKPVANSEPSGSGGRYAYAFGSDQSTFTVRNGGGMATIQALLPKSGQVTLVGGLDYAGNTCKQVGLNSAKALVVTGSGGDCRYLVQGTIGGVTDWYNYAPVGGDGVSGDNGKWRLEFSPAAKPAAGAAQYFLNVIRVTDTDNGTGPVSLRSEQAATLVDTGYETVGVQLGSDRRIIFNGGTKADMWPVWNTANFSGTTLVVGMVPNHCYGLVDHEGRKALKPDVGCTYKSSDAGVITIR